MTIDRYTRAILTVIAAALVYLCVLQTPWPRVSAQTALRPGDPTGPAEVVVIGWKAPVIPVQVTDAIRVAGEVRVTGNVRTRQEDNAIERVVMAGWEDAAGTPRTYQTFSTRAPNIRALPVSAYTPREGFAFRRPCSSQAVRSHRAADLLQLRLQRLQLLQSDR